MARIVVVGGTSGIGLAVAADLDRDHQVTVLGRSPGRLAAAVAALGERAGGQQLDATDRAGLDRFFAAHQRVDHLVVAVPADAGGGPFAGLDLADVTAAQLGKSRTQLAVVQAALPVLSANGSVTLIGGATADMARSATVGGGGGQRGHTRGGTHPRGRVGPRRVNAVAPGVVDPPWWSRIPGERRDAIFADTAARPPAGRVGTVADVAHAVRFLVENTYVTGIVLHVDGGLRLRG